MGDKLRESINVRGVRIRVIERELAELQREHCFTQAYLASELSITPQHIAVLHRYAKFVYDCGDYAAASNLLVHFRQLTTDTEASFSALWGKLGAAVVGLHDQRRAPARQRARPPPLRRRPQLGADL